MKNESLLPITARNVNINRGAWICDSGPMGLSHLDNSSSLNKSFDNNGGNNSDNCNGLLEYREMEVICKQRECESAELRERSPALVSDKRPSGSDGCRTTDVTSPRPGSERKRKRVERHSAVTVSEATDVTNVNSSENWQTVSKRKKTNYRYRGTAGISRDMEGKFKAADIQVPIFITKIHKDTTEKDIQEYIYRKTKEMINLEKISFKQDRDHSAYKFFVSEHKLPVFLDNKLWPQGILFRRFVNFKRKYANDRNFVSASNNNYEK
ncbi:uncharacterized protein LOC114363449 [Ostrinia furnacalis]|nr:uncharacterized protein LOC114363449 [Ostrinia furnacalis]